jgi:hypothetical protein
VIVFGGLPCAPFASTHEYNFLSLGVFWRNECPVRQSKLFLCPKCYAVVTLGHEPCLSRRPQFRPTLHNTILHWPCPRCNVRPYRHWPSNPLPPTAQVVPDPQSNTAPSTLTTLYSNSPQQSDLHPRSHFLHHSNTRSFTPTQNVKLVVGVL